VLGAGITQDSSGNSEFRPLRIFVNDELKSLETFLDSSMKVLRPEADWFWFRFIRWKIESSRTSFVRQLCLASLLQRKSLLQPMTRLTVIHARAALVCAPGRKLMRPIEVRLKRTSTTSLCA